MTTQKVVLNIVIPRKSWNPKTKKLGVLIHYSNDLTVAQGLLVRREITNEEREAWRKILKKLKPNRWSHKSRGAEVFVYQP